MIKYKFLIFFNILKTLLKSYPNRSSSQKISIKAQDPSKEMKQENTNIIDYKWPFLDETLFRGHSLLSFASSLDPKDANLGASYEISNKALT